MDNELSPSLEITKSYSAFKKQCSLEPTEYLVWHALLLTCLSENNELETLVSVSITEIATNIPIHREKIRRALVKLKKKRLAKQLGSHWIFLTDGLSHEH